MTARHGAILSKRHLIRLLKMHANNLPMSKDLGHEGPNGYTWMYNKRLKMAFMRLPLFTFHLKAKHLQNIHTFICSAHRVSIVSSIDI